MAEKKGLSEEELLKRLRVRHSEKAGNGYAHAFIPKVRNAAGFNASRTIDALSMSLWPSRGLTLTAYECKSSRSDWLRELKKPDKAEAFCELADYFYIVAGGTDIIRAGELPETWGLMVPHGAHLRAEVEAPRLREPDGNPPSLPPGFDRSFLAALLRAACAVGDVTPVEIQEAVAEAREQDKQMREMCGRDYEEMYNKLLGEVGEFERSAGIKISQRWPEERSPKEIGAVMRMVLNGEHDVSTVEQSLRRLSDMAQCVIDNVNGHLDGDRPLRSV